MLALVHFHLIVVGAYVASKFSLASRCCFGLVMAFESLMLRIIESSFDQF
jgi:hypothetical protein